MPTEIIGGVGVPVLRFFVFGDFIGGSDLRVGALGLAPAVLQSARRADRACRHPAPTDLPPASP